MHKCFLIITAAILIFSLIGCERKFANGLLFSSEVDGEQALHTDPYFISFHDVPVRVVDLATSEPIRNAAVGVVCMGGTPHSDSRGSTDDNGDTTVVYRTGSYAVISVSADKYIPWMGVVRSDVPVVRLVRSPD
jgi:hypothetical protein